MTYHGAHPHRQRQHEPIPNWLKVFYATLLFLTFIILTSELLHK